MTRLRPAPHRRVFVLISLFFCIFKTIFEHIEAKLDQDESDDIADNTAFKIRTLTAETESTIGLGHRRSPRY